MARPKKLSPKEMRLVMFLIQEQGISQSEIARRFQLHQSNISRYVRSK